MKEVFQDYKHYSKWVIQHWKYQTTDLDQLIIDSDLLIRIDHHNTDAYRMMYMTEFSKKESDGLIFIPNIELCKDNQ
jgi:hypothetical protein